jgi:hypothetical protein
MARTVPEFTFGKGRTQINLKGRDAIREGGWSIRALLLARALAILVPAIALTIAIFLLRPG